MGFGIGPGLWGILGIVLLWIFLVILAVWLVRFIFGSPQSPKSHLDRPLTPREILDQRYARGEINREQYEIMKKDIS
jgi:putative membrane protein